MFFKTDWKKLPLRPRFNTLIIGSTGTGKTHLTKVLAETLRKPLLAIDVTSWVVLGASHSGCSYTWESVLEFISKNESAGGLIFIDEICKIGGGASSHQWTSWDTHLRVELFALLDGRIPPDVKLPEDDDCIDWDNLPPDRRQLGESLREKFLIIAAGAFQDEWDKRPHVAMGFDRQDTPPPTEVSEFTEYIPRELLNRFRAKILKLSMAARDYEALIMEIAPKLPKPLRKDFRSRCQAHLPAAIAPKKASGSLKNASSNCWSNSTTATKDKSKPPGNLRAIPLSNWSRYEIRFAHVNW